MENVAQFICFEGLDGAGKTSVSESVCEELRKAGLPVTFVDKKSVEFNHPYLGAHMAALKGILWDYVPDSPIHLLGDHHWLYLVASWFSVLDHCKISPCLAQGQLVIVDNWYYKFLARFRLKTTVQFAHVRACFSAIHKPDLVILLDADPAVAATRKRTFSASEAGNADGLSGLTTANFVQYQNRVRASLDELLSSENVVRVNTSELSASDVAATVAEQLVRRLRRTG
jgi:dTMP kinase